MGGRSRDAPDGRRADRGAPDDLRPEGRGSSFGPEHLVERSGELRVPVVGEEPDVLQPILDGEVPSLLGDPRGVGVRGDAGDSGGARTDYGRRSDMTILATRV